MLYGHLESRADRIDHLRRLRELQDETGHWVHPLGLSTGKQWDTGRARSDGL